LSGLVIFNVLLYARAAELLASSLGCLVCNLDVLVVVVVVVVSSSSSSSRVVVVLVVPALVLVSRTSASTTTSYRTRTTAPVVLGPQARTLHLQFGCQ
jgi:hypothetical protein